MTAKLHFFLTNTNKMCTLGNFNKDQQKKQHHNFAMPFFLIYQKKLFSKFDSRLCCSQTCDRNTEW